MAVLRGLDSALSAELAQQLQAASSEARDARVLEALRERLAQMPQRADWDRIEAVVPRFAWETRDGMPNRLGGIGVYVKPTSNPWELLDEDSIDRKGDYADAEQTTLNPRTGEQQQDTAYVAPFIAFDRVTLDAKTLAVLARKPQFTHTQYSDRKSDSINVIEQVSPALIVTQLQELVERTAYRSVRGSVEVGPVKPLANEVGRPLR